MSGDAVLEQKRALVNAYHAAIVVTQLHAILDEIKRRTTPTHDDLIKGLKDGMPPPVTFIDPLTAAQRVTYGGLVTQSIYATLTNFVNLISLHGRDGLASVQETLNIASNGKFNIDVHAMAADPEMWRLITMGSNSILEVCRQHTYFDVDPDAIVQGVQNTVKVLKQINLQKK